MNQKNKTIGILGGMGPEATAELYLRIVRNFQLKGAKYDSDFPEFYINSIPLPDVIENNISESLVKTMLIDGVKKLEYLGSSFIAIPCNSVFTYYKEMHDAVKIPIINIMEETAKEAGKKGYKKVGLLGTKLTTRNKLFEKSLKKYDVLTINPTIKQQDTITKVIVNILKGKKLKNDKKKLLLISNCLKKLGAEAIILGCTELPLITKNNNKNIKFLDTIEIIANAIMKKSNTNNYLN